MTDYFPPIHILSLDNKTGSNLLSKKLEWKKRGLKNSPLLQKFMLQCKMENANKTVPIIKRYALVNRFNDTSKFMFQNKEESYGKEWIKYERRVKTAQKKSVECLYRGQSSLEIEKEKISIHTSSNKSDDLNMSKDDRLSYEKKYKLKLNFPSRKEHKKREPNNNFSENDSKMTSIVRAKVLPGNPNHDTFPTIFPIRNMYIALR